MPPAWSGRSARRCKRWKVGDEVIVHCNQDDGDDEECNGGDPLLSPSQRIWGYETPDGSFAQFCRVQSRQLMQKPAASHLGRSGLLHADARHRLSHAVRPSRRTRSSPATTCWYGAPRAGSACSACNLPPRPARTRSASISDESKRDYVLDLGAKGVINRKDFKCWGQMPKVEHARIQRLGERGAQVRQGDLGHHRQARRRYRVRASRRSDVPGVVPGGEARRHGRVLRRHLRLQHHLRRALCLDAAEAHPGLALRASEAGLAPPTSSCSTAASIPA